MNVAKASEEEMVVAKSQWSRRVVALVAASMLAASLPGVAVAVNPEGSLDAAFDGDGKVTTPIGSGNDLAAAVVLQADGKIVVAGRSYNGTGDDFGVARYNANGSLDTTFGTGGKVTTPVGLSDDDGLAVALQPDGRIVVAGYTYNGTNKDIALVRYTANGSLDTTFDGDGKVTTAFGAEDERAAAVALQPDGRIVVAGYTYNGTNKDIALVRYTANGSLDTTFDGDGKVTTAFGSDNAEAHALAIQTDGRIVVAGSAGSEMAVARYSASGSLDAAFGSGGVVSTPVGIGVATGFAVALQPDGRIVLAGQTYNGSDDDVALVRYNANGTADASFGSGGIVTTGIGSSHDQANAIALQPDGRIIVAGQSFTGASYDFALVRYAANGSLDPTFGSGGKVTTGIGSDNEFGAGVALQPDGRIVVAGPSNTSTDADFAVARYVGDATAPYGARMVGVPRYGTALARTLEWRASDDNTGVASYDVRYRSAAYTASTYGSFTAWKTGTTSSFGTFTGTAGRTYCFSVRGRDVAGNVGAYGPESCLALPVNDRSLVRTGSWISVSSTTYYLGTGSRSTSAGAALTRTGVAYRHLAVVVTTCSTCGTIKVYRGTTLLKTISLVSATTKHKVIIDVASSVGVTTGTIIIKQASGGKAVTIEGLAVSLN